MRWSPSLMPWQPCCSTQSWLRAWAPSREAYCRLQTLDFSCHFCHEAGLASPLAFAEAMVKSCTLSKQGIALTIARTQESRICMDSCCFDSHERSQADQHLIVVQAVDAILQQQEAPEDVKKGLVDALAISSDPEIQQALSKYRAHP
jgi:hypothetical protein